MDLEIHWSGRIPLIDGSDKSLIYRLEDLSIISERSGIYIFAREFGKRMIPLYIGRAQNLRTRVTQHIEKNTKLMMGIKNSPSGTRYLVVGELRSKCGRNERKALAICEASLIEHSLAQTFDIFNKSGTKQPFHTIKFKGNRFAKSLTGPLIKVKTRIKIKGQ